MRHAQSESPLDQLHKLHEYYGKEVTVTYTFYGNVLKYKGILKESDEVTLLLSRNQHLHILSRNEAISEVRWGKEIIFKNPHIVEGLRLATLDAVDEAILDSFGEEFLKRRIQARSDLLRERREI